MNLPGVKDLGGLSAVVPLVERMVVAVEKIAKNTEILVQRLDDKD